MSLSVVVLSESSMLPISSILRLVSVLDGTPSNKSSCMFLDFDSSWSFSTCIFEFVHVLFIIVNFFMCNAVEVKINLRRLYDLILR